MQYTLKDLGLADFPRACPGYLTDRQNGLAKEFVLTYLEILNTEDCYPCYVVEGCLGPCNYTSVVFLEIEEANIFKAKLDKKLSRKAKYHGHRQSKILTFNSISDAEKFRVKRLKKEVLPTNYNFKQDRLSILRELQTQYLVS